MKFRERFFIGLILWGVLCALGVLSVKASPLADCKPIVKASGYPVGPLVRDGGQGKHLFFFCAAPTHEYVVGLSCRWADCNVSQFSAALAKVLTAPDRAAAIESEWAAQVTWSCDAPPDEAKRALCVERAGFAETALAEATRGYLRPVYRVKNNGLINTRPAFTLINGVIGLKEAGRAPVGTVCDLTKPTAPATGTDVRAEFGVAGLVTICAKGIL